MNRENKRRKSNNNKFFADNAVKIVKALREASYLKEYQTKNVSLVSDTSGNVVDFHKVVLVTCSDYFKKLFDKMGHSDYLIKKEAYVIPMEGCTNEVLQSFKEFLYTGKVNIEKVRFLSREALKSL